MCLIETRLHKDRSAPSDSISLHCAFIHIHSMWFDHYIHGLRRPRDKIAFTAWPKIQSQSQIFRYCRSIICLPHRPNVFDLCLHWVSVVRDYIYTTRVRIRLARYQQIGSFVFFPLNMDESLLCMYSFFFSQQQRHWSRFTDIYHPRTILQSR